MDDALRSLLPGVNFNRGATAQPRKRKAEEQLQKSSASPGAHPAGLAPSALPQAKATPQEAAAVLRKSNRIKVAGDEPCAPLRDFGELTSRHQVPEPLCLALSALGFSTPTAIQMQALPLLLGGRHVLGVAPTGSGKTLAYMVPALACAAQHAAQPGPIALVLQPTKELQLQSYHVAKRLAAGLDFAPTLMNKAAAAGSDFEKARVLVATPLRAVRAIKRRRLDAGNIRLLVLDEADHLMAGKFLHHVDALVGALDRSKLTVGMFSATLPQSVEDLAASVLDRHVRVTVGERNAAASTVQQRLVFVGKDAGKAFALRDLMRGGGMKAPILVFVSSSERAKQLHSELLAEGQQVDSLYAGKGETARALAMTTFRSGATWTLIATDLVGRGIDFADVNTVINYDLPGDGMTYVHRIGRAGRAGRTGEAVSFFTEKDLPQLRRIVNIVRQSGCEVPEWMLHLGSKSKTRHKRRPIQIQDT